MPRRGQPHSNRVQRFEKTGAHIQRHRQAAATSASFRVAPVLGKHIIDGVRLYDNTRACETNPIQNTAAGPVLPVTPLAHLKLPLRCRHATIDTAQDVPPHSVPPARSANSPIPARALKRSHLGHPRPPLRRGATPWPPRPQTRRQRTAAAPASSSPPAPRPWRAGPDPFCFAPA